MEKSLLIDIGNTNIKLAETGRGPNLSKVKFFPYDKHQFVSSFIKIFEGYKRYKKAGISLADPTLEQEVKNIILTLYGITPVIVNNKSLLPIKIKYKSVLGSDRICSSSAAYAIFKRKNILVIDFGTATTYNLIINGIFTGGVIAPGIKTSLDSLLRNSPLPSVKLSLKKNYIADNTKEAISNGVMAQAIFSAEKIIADLKKKHKGLYVAATGGYSSLAAKYTRALHTVDKDLVLKGINIILKNG